MQKQIIITRFFPLEIVVSHDAREEIESAMHDLVRDDTLTDREKYLGVLSVWTQARLIDGKTRHLTTCTFFAAAMMLLAYIVFGMVLGAMAATHAFNVLNGHGL